MNGLRGISCTHYDLRTFVHFDLHTIVYEHECV